MKRRMRDSLRKHPVLSAIFAVALLATVVFGIRMLMFMAHWGPPPPDQQPIEGWMTPRYVAFSWDIPKPEMFAIMARITGLDNPPDKPMPIERIAENSGMTTAAFIDALDQEIAAYRAANPDHAGDRPHD